ncbi:MAG TPA: zinc-dependent alcohol dehydrogenase family protein [Methylotenera sp.]|nr:zinc-dependent alcohol dehydrogenase family protein [Methylotenera sp.]
MARIVRFNKTGGAEVLQIVEESVTAPASNEVQIQVHAIGLNRAETMYRNGMYLETPQFPSRLGYEAAGRVTAVGKDVTEFKVGDAVSTIPAFSMNQYGSYGELVNMPAHAVAKNPASLSWVEASAIWMQYTTAYGALVDIANINAGDFVLITAASSSVGIAAIEIANMLGATPIAMTRKSNKKEALLKVGAKYVIASEEQDIVAEVNKITHDKGARVVFDPVGGPTLNKLADATALGGIIFQYGALSTEPTPLPLFAVLSKQLTIRGYVLFELSTNPLRLAKAKKFVIEGLNSGKLKPIIAKTFPFEQIAEAHRYMESNEQLGKIVVTVN